MSWPVVRLKDIADLINGDRSKNYPSGSDIVDSGVLFLNSKNIVNNKLDLRFKNFITQEKFESLSRGKLERNDLVITLRGTLGSCCIFSSKYATGFINAQMMIIRPNNKVDADYLYYFITSPDTKNRFERLNTGSAVPQLTGKQVGELEIPLPPLEEQKRIAAILGKADAIRQKRKQAIDLADEFLRSVFLDMFGDPVTNPKGLEIQTLGDLAANKGYMVDGPFGSSVNTKVDYVENGEIPVIRTKNVSNNGEFKNDDLKFMTREKYETVIRSQVLPGDIVLTKVGTIGNVCIFPSDYPEAVLSTTGSCRIRLSSDLVTKTYLFFYLQLYKKKMLEIASAGVQPFLNMKHIKGFEVPIPPTELIEQFGNLVNKARGLACNQKLSNPDILFEALSQKAFSGQL